MPILVGYGIYVLLALFVTIGAALMTRPLSGGFIGWLQQQASRLPAFGGLSLEQIVRLDRWIVNKLGKHAKAIEGAGIGWLTALAKYVEAVGYWSLYWPIALYHQMDWLTTHHIPKAIKARTQPLDRRIDVAEAQAKAAAGQAHSNTVVIRKGGTVTKVTKIERVAMPHAKEWEWIHDHWKALTHAVTGTVAAAGVIAIPGRVEWRNPLDALRRAHGKRLKRLEKLLGVSGIALIMARALGLGSARCLRGGNLAKAARRICGLDSSLFNSLMLDLVAILSVVSVVEFANDLRAIEDEALSVASKMIREWPS